MLIGGSTSYDSNFADFDSLLKEWTRTDLTYAQIENHIVNGGGYNIVKLNANTVFSAASSPTSSPAARYRSVLLQTPMVP